MKKIIIAVSLLAVMASCAKERVPQEFTKGIDPEMLGVSKESIANLEATLESFVNDKKVPCVTAFVAKGGNVVYEKSFGHKDLETMAPAEIDDIYVLFSQTKAIVAVAFMTLYEQGLVKLDDPISKWIPGFSDTVITGFDEETGEWTMVEAERPAQVGDFLCHSSGYLAPNTNRYLRSLTDRPVVDRSTVGNVVESNKEYPLGFQPGSDWNYNYDMDVIAYLIEIVTGKTLQEYLKEVIFEPLGMDYTAYYYDDMSLLPRVVKTYRKDGDDFVVNNFFGARSIFEGPKTYAGGTYGLYGPIEDYAKFCQMMLNKGAFNNHRILKEETVDLMLQNRLPEVNSGGEGFQFGIGFELFGNPNKKKVPQMSSSSFRWAGAAGTEYLVDPENDLVILYYISMWGDTNTYTAYLDAVYKMFE
ncbi:MAG: serine hydrolase domain-containing protein [Candidatus Cryptobacteroides sp.]|jgi:CubicO group peptidase (beta-lactamase class C family)